MFTRGFKSWCENVALQQRRELNLCDVDPLDPKLLAKRLDIKIWTAAEVPGLEPEYLKILTEEDPNSWSAVTICVGSKSLIILNPTHTGGRPASDLMHEISHILIGHKPARLDVTEDGLLILHTYDRQQEEEAKWLAGCLLLPRGALLSIRKQSLDLRVATKKYGVSPDMLSYRMRIMGIKYQFSR